jgi:hypothetical protein
MSTTVHSKAKDHPHTSKPHTSDANTHKPEDHPPSLNVDHLLRIHIIQAKIDKPGNYYCVVATGRHSIRTKEVKTDKDPVFDEHFVIEYSDGDKQNDVTITLFDKGVLRDSQVGQWRSKIHEVFEPETPTNQEQGKKRSKQEKASDKAKSWFSKQPATLKVVDSKNNGMADLNVRMRRERKVEGELKVTIKDIILKNPPSTVPEGSVHTLVKFGNFSHPTLDIPTGTKGKYSYKKPYPVATADVNHQNNCKDVFIEVYRSGMLVGMLRVIPFDTVKKFGDTGDLIYHREVTGQLRYSCELIKPKDVKKK